MNNKWKYLWVEGRWMLFLLGILFCATWLPLLISSGKALLWRDLSILMYPSKKIWAEGVLATGFPPLWTSAILGGSPFLAECNWGVFNPLNLVFLLYKWLPFPLLFSWFLFLHHVVLGIGAYLLGKELTQKKEHGYLCAIFFLTNGVTWSCLYLTHMLGSLTVAPYFFLFLHRFIQRPKTIKLFPLSITIGLPILLGDPQASILFSFLASIILFSNLRRWVAFQSVFCLGGLSFLFSAIQSLPSYNLAKQSIRLIQGFSIEEVLWWSFHPMRFFEWIWPIGPAWQEKFSLGPDPGPFVLNTFYGIGPLVLLALSFFISWKKRERYLWVIVFTIVLVSIGGFWPASLMKILNALPSILALFRYPERLLCFVFPIFIYLIFLRIRATEVFFQKSRDKVIFLLCVVQFFQFILLKDLVFLPSPSNEMHNAEGIWSQKLFALKVKDSEKWRLGAAKRFHSRDQSTIVPNVSGSNINRLVSHDWKVWSQNIPAYFDYDTAAGFHTLQPEWYLNFWRTLSKKQTMLFSLLSIRYYTALGKDGKDQLHENEAALPYIYFPQKLLGASDMEAAVLALVNHEAVLGSIGVFGNNRLQDFQLASENDNKNRVLNVERGFGSLQVEVEVNSDQGHVFLWNEKYSEGWTAKVDGKPVLPFRANIWAMGVPLPAAHKAVHVEFQYQEPMLNLGLICLAVWMVMAVCFYWSEKRNRILN